MRRFSAVVLISCFALAVESYAAQKIALSCMAIELNSDTGESSSTGAKSIVVDADQGTVTTDIGVFAITQDTEKVVSFQDRAWKGELDRPGPGLWLRAFTSQGMSKWSLRASQRETADVQLISERHLAVLCAAAVP
jgi:hypothetical protein